MIRLLIKKFVPDYENVKDNDVRKKYGVLGGTLGIVCNLILFLAKMVAGLLTHSMAVIADAFNNLSDISASVVSLFGASLSGRKADKGHPYGHGRGEYIAALMVAVLIIIMGVELLRSSIDRIFNAQAVVMGKVSVAILIGSIFVKLWMWSYNRYISKKIDSDILRAAAKDSISDVFATGAVILSILLSGKTDFPIDAVVGILVSVLICISGIGVARGTIDKLLGRNPEENIREQIEVALLEEDEVLGMHGLMVHDYGPGRIIASVHAEVPDNLTLVECHDIIDKIEKKILAEFNIDIVIHMDPVGRKS